MQRCERVLGIQARYDAVLRVGETERNVGAHCHRHRHRRSVSKERGGRPLTLGLCLYPRPHSQSLLNEQPTPLSSSSPPPLSLPIEIYLREKERISSFALSFLFFSCSVNDGIKVKGDLILLIPFLPFHSRISPLPPFLGV